MPGTQSVAQTASDTLAALESRVRLLEDERAILHTLYTYGHGIDYGLEDEYADCWVPEAVLYWPARDPLVGREAIMHAFRQHTHAPDKYHKHFIAEARIVIDGDRATSDCYFTRADDYDVGPQMRSFGRYRDILLRGEDDRWRFLERRCEREARRKSDYATSQGSDG
jgi:ketosteroid isomerase-like protein